MLARATTFTLLGIEGIRVTVEADIHTGLPSFTIVGLGDAAVQESRERVRAALVNSGFDFPLRRITVNLAPADLRKAGPAFDLALAAGLLAASGQAPPDRLAGHAFCGELGLDGSVRRVRGAIAMADAAATAGCEGIVVPSDNAGEAALVEGLDVVPVETVRELAAFLAGDGPPAAERLDARDWLATDPPEGEDFAQLRGHRALKHALEVAAAGNHNVLMMGPPGSGKSMAARRLPSIMPPLSFGDALEVTRIHSVAGVLGPAPLVQRRPFRAPHHSISAPGLVGGGGPPSPGEASLAQHGVLFLDELSEFARPALEALRQPLEEGCVRITRAQRTVSFPARFLLAAATNPCPCGYQGDPRRECSCHPSVAARYRARLSGPLLDRIDMILRVEQPRAKDVMAEAEPEGSRTIRERVLAARAVQEHRLRGSPAACNAHMSHAQLRRVGNLEPAARAALHDAHERAGLTMRGHDRVLRVARTLADLDGSDRVLRRHVAQAVAYREPPPAPDGAVAGGVDVTACDGCLRRTALLGLLAPWVERARKPNRRRLPEVLALPDDELVEALCGPKRAEVDGPLARFDPARARARAEAAGIEVVCRHASRYPPVLAHAADAPAALHLIGDGALLERAARDGAVAIVGSRRASSYGIEMAWSLARDLAACDVTVVSGMAWGADSAAHAGALAAGGPTIAVMPGGVDLAYPPGKRRLHEQLKTCGLAVSEMPPGMRPFRWSFPARNRIMAALARMTIVVEGTEGSGSLITASFAQDLGRDVGAVPGQATSPLAAGPNRLLAEGAAVVRSASDVLDALFGPGKRLVDAAGTGAAPHAALAARLEPRLRRLLESVENGIGSVEGLAEGRDVAEALAGLSELEFLGFVGRGPGGDYVRRV